MARVGRWVIDPRIGAHCTIALDSGGKIVVNHDKAEVRGGSVTVERLKLLGFSSDRLFSCDPDQEPGASILRFRLVMPRREAVTRVRSRRS